VRRLVVAGLLVALIVFPLSAYVFLKGMEYGVARYKSSTQFKMTLFSIYTMGFWDACDHPKLCEGK
jgi:hypothetical protein